MLQVLNFMSLKPAWFNKNIALSWNIYRQSSLQSMQSGNPKTLQRSRTNHCLIKKVLQSFKCDLVPTCSHQHAIQHLLNINIRITIYPMTSISTAAQGRSWRPWWGRRWRCSCRWRGVRSGWRVWWGWAGGRGGSRGWWVSWERTHCEKGDAEPG